MNQHTPGPWKAHKIMPKTKLRAPEPETYVTAGPNDWPGNRVVAACHHVDGSHASANAALIAAAPDLLAACRRAVHLYDHDDATSVLEWVNSPEFRAAIAKAEGGAE